MFGELENIVNNFKESTNKISYYIDLLDKLDLKAKSDNFSDEEKKLFFETRQISYNAIVITLYGQWESTIKNLLKEYVLVLTKNHKLLSNKVREKYIDACIKKISNRSDEYEKSLESLHYTINLQDYSKFIYSLMFEDTGNMKVKIVKRLLADADLCDGYKEALNFRDTIEKYKEVYGFTNLDDAKKSLMLDSGPFVRSIDELVDSRNKIAHLGSEDNMLDRMDLKLKTIPMMLAFVKGLVNFMMINIFKLEYHELTELNIERTISHNEFLVNSPQTIAVHSLIIMENANNQIYSLARIEQLLLNNEKTGIVFGENEIRIKLNVSARNNVKLFMINSQ